MKCVFGVPAGKLLGFLISSCSIEVSPEKVEAIEHMQPPRHLKEAQRLTGCMAALGRFISKLGERGLPLFKLLKKTSRFEWTEEAEQAFRGLKGYVSSPAVLVAPHDKEELLLYTSAISQVVSTVLVVERGGEDPRDRSLDPRSGTPRGTGKSTNSDPKGEPTRSPIMGPRSRATSLRITVTIWI